jgi:acetyl-CoA carboxylase biotin carboxyl carrier protein
MGHESDGKIRELLSFAKKHGLAEMMWQENGLRVAFRRNLSPKSKSNVPASAPLLNGQVKPESPNSDAIITSPLVGTFRRSLSKDHPPLVLEGTKVKPGDRVGVVECMKIPTDVVSFAEGTISKILLEDGQVVEYGQPLFSVTSSKSTQSNGKK